MNISQPKAIKYYYVVKLLYMSWRNYIIRCLINAIRGNSTSFESTIDDIKVSINTNAALKLIGSESINPTIKNTL